MKSKSRDISLLAMSPRAGRAPASGLAGCLAYWSTRHSSGCLASVRSLWLGHWPRRCLAGLRVRSPGAAGGGLLGALVGWGVSREHVLKYEATLKSGKYLIIAHGSAEDVKRARNILQGTGASEVTVHAAM